MPGSWSLATVESDGRPVACIETADGLFALEPSLARVGLLGRATVQSLFDDWAPPRQRFRTLRPPSHPPTAS